MLALAVRCAYYVLADLSAGFRTGEGMTTISKRSVDATKAAEKDSYLWDKALKGFGLKVTPAGRKVYLIQYRVGGRKGRTRRVTIGVHGVFTADQARARAKQLLGDVAAGRDPAATQQEERGSRRLGELLTRFLEEHAEHKLKPSTAAEYRRLARLYILPVLQHRLVREINRSDVVRLHSSLAAKPYQANRMAALLSKFFNWCERQGHRPDNSNPCRHVEKFGEAKRERFLTPEELTRLGAALRAAAAERTASPWTIGAIRLLALTGARLSEILTLKWEFVNFERAMIRLPDSKTGAKTLYLNAPAVAVLNELPRIEGNPFAIVGERKGARLVNLQKPWRRIRMAAGLNDVRLHDLRHSFASAAAAGGMSLPLIGALLGHSQPQTTARYAHLSADPLRAASEAVAGQIFGAMNRVGAGQTQPT
jgi:integrase